MNGTTYFFREAKKSLLCPTLLLAKSNFVKLWVHYKGLSNARPHQPYIYTWAMDSSALYVHSWRLIQRRLPQQYCHARSTHFGNMLKKAPQIQPWCCLLTTALMILFTSVGSVIEQRMLCTRCLHNFFVATIPNADCFYILCTASLYHFFSSYGN